LFVNTVRISGDNTMRNSIPAVINVGQQIKRARKAKGLSQPALSELCGWGYNQARISHYETGRNKITTDDLQTIAAALEMRLVDLLDDGAKAAPRPRATRATKLAELILSLPIKRQEALFVLLENLQGR
jgi:transcriptional regulator with XRE-family HTH domain